MDNRPVRVRFAPSPTGPLHMGGVRTALYNYLFAKRNNGTFILRIEDTDQTRFVPGAEEYITEALEWCGISPDEGVEAGGEYGPYRQSERKGMYRQYADLLVESGNAYYAFDTELELEEMRDKATKAGMPNWQYNNITRNNMRNSLTLPEDEVRRRLDAGDAFVIRMKVPRNEEVRLHDEIRGWVAVQTSQMDDKVLFKSDGMPTYHLANVVDDYLMKITHVIRGEEWLPSAPLHVLIYKAFGWDDVMPKFAHLPLLLRPDGNGKLSKRDGDRLGFPVFPISGNLVDPKSGNNESFTGYREKGYFPQAFVNMLALLGWNPGTNQEIFSMDELIQAFSLERVSKSGAKFDFDKTRWFNQQYLRTKSDEELAELLKNESEGLEEFSLEYLSKVSALMKERAVFVEDIREDGAYFFDAPRIYDEQAVKKRWKEGAGYTVNSLREAFSRVEPFSAAEIEKAFNQFLQDHQLNLGAVLPLFRLSVTGKMAGPGMFEVAELLGKNETLQRMESAVKELGQTINQQS